MTRMDEVLALMARMTPAERESLDRRARALDPNADLVGKHDARYSRKNTTGRRR